MKHKIFVVLTVLLCAVLFQSAVMADENAAAYLKAYYDIDFKGSSVSTDEFNAALNAMDTEPVEAETLTLSDAVVGAVRLAKMEELALAYAGKAAGILADEEIRVDEKYAPYAAIALELDLVDDDEDFNGPVSALTAAEMLYHAAEISGKGRHFIGRISDDDILSELQSAMSSALIFDDEILSEAGIEILLSEATTGYSMKYAGNDARFLEENTVRYSHDDPLHILQLAALLKAENIDAYVQVEPKVSVYEYLPEWGDPGEPSPKYAVHEMVEGRFFAFALEIDVVFEFDSTADKGKFHELVEAYANKYDDCFDADGNLIKPLLINSFWQPLYYSSSSAGMENEVFKQVTDNVISFEGDSYSLHSISLEENSDAVAEAAARIDSDLKVVPVTVTVNPSFYSYLTGEDHQ